MNQETKECMQVSGILLFFGSLIIYGGWYLIGGIAVVGSIVVALMPLFMNPKIMDRIAGFFGSGNPGPIPWYASPLPYLIIIGGVFVVYTFAT